MKETHASYRAATGIGKYSVLILIILIIIIII